MTSTCGFDGAVNLWARAWGIWEMKSVTLHASGNWHLNTGVSTLEQSLADNWPECKFSVLQNQSLFGTLFILLETLNWHG